MYVCIQIPLSSKGSSHTGLGPTQSSHVLFYNPMDRSPPGSSVHGILQARIMEWAAISFSRHLPNPGIKPTSPELAGRSFTL